MLIAVVVIALAKLAGNKEHDGYTRSGNDVLRTTTHCKNRVPEGGDQ